MTVSQPLLSIDRSCYSITGTAVLVARRASCTAALAVLVVEALAAATAILRTSNSAVVTRIDSSLKHRRCRPSVVLRHPIVSSHCCPL